MSNQGTAACPPLVMHGTVTVWSKGQIVIPKKVRELLHIEEGEELVVFVKGDLALGLVKTTDMQILKQYLDDELQA